jgi:hypothetical protein
MEIKVGLQLMFHIGATAFNNHFDNKLLSKNFHIHASFLRKVRPVSITGSAIRRELLNQINFYGEYLDV